MTLDDWIYGIIGGIIGGIIAPYIVNWIYRNRNKKNNL